eukprot:CAMPEP_0184687212 /NCGR_PEP_ID=MMETSP0312-20130426/25614_1 /TAXON_ID=31354 /ORGANISM="Compsopogon coeruleus, Strain SAG 36.94" /LENGTH=218 /DNA_ID=CAMNT_0027143121 /DNA_START=79 /DNA_END=735 /DNA_ORIENTATION=-
MTVAPYGQQPFMIRNSTISGSRIGNILVNGTGFQLTQSTIDSSQVQFKASQRNVLADYLFSFSHVAVQSGSTIRFLGPLKGKSSYSMSWDQVRTRHSRVDLRTRGKPWRNVMMGNGSVFQRSQVQLNGIARVSSTADSRIVATNVTLRKTRDVSLASTKIFGRSRVSIQDPLDGKSHGLNLTNAILQGGSRITVDPLWNIERAGFVTRTGGRLIRSME